MHELVRLEHTGTGFVGWPDVRLHSFAVYGTPYQNSGTDQLLISNHPGAKRSRMLQRRFFVHLRTLASLATAIVFLSVGGPVLAHPGGLNAEGCHNNRKTGDYHCHHGSTSRAPHPSRQPDRFAGNTGAYRNCTEARAAGAAPVRRGSPGYGPHLDRDGDGIGCEPYRGR